MRVKTFEVFKRTGSQRQIDVLRRKCWCTQQLVEKAYFSRKRVKKKLGNFEQIRAAHITPNRTERKRNEFPVAGA